MSVRPLGPNSPAAPGAPDADAKQLQATARDLEGVFVGMMFEEMAKTVEEADGLYPKTPGRDVYEGWFRTEIAQRWAKGGGAGLGDQIAKSLGADAPAPRPVGPRFGSPADGPVSSTFGPRVHPVTGHRDFHEGVDLAVPVGSPVRSPFPGKVVAVAEDPHLGLAITVEHPGGYRSVYGHTEASLVKVGQSVAAGEVIGRSGQSGRVTGPHLHFALYHQGKAVDPSRWVSIRGPLTPR